MVGFSAVQLERSYNLVNQYFPVDQYTMLQNHTWVKDQFKLQDKPINFKVNSTKGMVSDFSLQLIFKKLPFVKLRNIKKECPYYLK